MNKEEKVVHTILFPLCLILNLSYFQMNIQNIFISLKISANLKYLMNRVKNPKICD